MIDCHRLVSENNQHLQQAIDIINQINDELFCNNENPFFQGGVGKHFRHILDFYDRFLEGWRDKIDYDARQRDEGVETDRQKCIQKIEDTMTALNQCVAGIDDAERGLSVKNDEDENDRGADPFSRSTVGRELQFLKFHAVHHFAIIAIMLRIQGIAPPKDFGFAASTLEYMNRTSRKQK